MHFIKPYRYLLFWATTVGMLHQIAHAQEPTWWSSAGTKVWQTNSVNVDNYAPINVGQLKNVAAKAKLHLDSVLSAAGGAGPETTQLVQGFIFQDPGNHAPANVGQLKAVAAPFYRRMAEAAVGFDPIAQLQLQMSLPSDASSVELGVRYPWMVPPPTGENFAPANLGQLKLVFGFDLQAWAAADSDNDRDGLSDSWEQSYFQTLAYNGEQDYDADGLPNWLEHLGFSSPADTDSDDDGTLDGVDADARVAITGATAFRAIAGKHKVIEVLDDGGGYRIAPAASPSDIRRYRAVTIRSTYRSIWGNFSGPPPPPYGIGVHDDTDDQTLSYISEKPLLSPNGFHAFSHEDRLQAIYRFSGPGIIEHVDDYSYIASYAQAQPPPAVPVASFNNSYGQDHIPIIPPMTYEQYSQSTYDPGTEPGHTYRDTTETAFAILSSPITIAEVLTGIAPFCTEKNFLPPLEARQRVPTFPLTFSGIWSCFSVPPTTVPDNYNAAAPIAVRRTRFTIRRPGAVTGSVFCEWTERFTYSDDPRTAANESLFPPVMVHRYAHFAANEKEKVIELNPLVSPFSIPQALSGRPPQVHPLRSPTPGTTSASLLPLEVVDALDNRGVVDIAWIKAHAITGTDVMPQMPRLDVRIAGLPASTQVEWRLENRYPRRGTRDDFVLPTTGQPGIIVAGDQPWRLWQSIQNAANIPQFFGGDLTIRFVIHEPSGDSHGETLLKIRGENPDDARCKAHIIANQGVVWYAWAIAKHESGDSNGFYNQFASGTASGGGAHGAPGEPFYAPSEGDGWGLFQRDSSSGFDVTTQETWSWHENMRGFLQTEYPGHLTIANNYVNSVAANNPATFEEPVFTIKGQSISGRDVLALTWYNGVQGRSNPQLLRFDGTRPSGQRWILGLPNAPRKLQPYVHEVMDVYNGG